MKLICVKDIGIFKKYQEYQSNGEDSYYDNELDENIEEYIFYTNYNYEYNFFDIDKVEKSYFMTLAEWRNYQINNIFNG